MWSVVEQYGRTFSADTAAMANFLHQPLKTFYSEQLKFCRSAGENGEYFRIGKRAMQMPLVNVEWIKCIVLG